MIDAAEPHPGLQQDDRAGVGARAATDLDLAPAGLAVDGQQQAAFACCARIWSVVVLFLARRLGAGIHAGGRRLGASEDLDPSGPVLGLVRAAIETDDFRAAQAAGEADRQDRLVAQAPQIVVERRQHREQVVGEDRFFLDGRSAMGASNAGEHGRDVPIARVQRLAEFWR